jgi:hypothetical protein
MLFAACAIAMLLIGAPAAAQQFPPVRVNPQGTLERVRPNLNGTWFVAAPLPGQLTLRPQSNGAITGNYWPLGLYNNARFPCWGQYSDTEYTFIVLCRSQQMRAVVYSGQAQVEGVSRTILVGHFHREEPPNPPGGLIDQVFRGEPVTQ